MFNPDPLVQQLQPVPGARPLLIIDDALSDPHAWVERAALHRADFEESPYNAYPGVELRMPEGVSRLVDEYFATHVRALLGARRTERMYTRLSMVTRTPEALSPPQWICHRDRMELQPGRCVAACVLYLFDDPSLGGTNFFMPRRSMLETAQLVHESGVLDAQEFTAKYGIERGYMSESNAWFERVASIPARWNRMLFYDGMLFHGGDIRRPQALGDDPRSARLTLNGFFVCRAAAR